MKLINIGYGNTVNSDRVVAAVSADAAPVKRIISAAKDNNTAIDATCGPLSTQMSRPAWNSSIGVSIAPHMSGLSMARDSAIA